MRLSNHSALTDRAILEPLVRESTRIRAVLTTTGDVLGSWSRLSTVLKNLAVTLGVVGERWALLIVREVSIGLRRFDELQQATGAPRAVVADRLRRLTSAGILLTRPYRTPGSRERQEYALTDAGLDLLPLLAAFSDWGQRHLGAGRTPDVDYRHVGCGGHVTARLMCECGQELIEPDRLIAQINR